MRITTVGALLAALVASAAAQFDGPAPLSWRFVQPTSVAPGGSPLVADGIIYQAIGGRIFAIEKDTGNLKWRFPQVDPIAGAFRNSPIVANGTLVVAGDNKIIYGVDRANGSTKWSFPTVQPVLGAPVQVGNAVVFATTDNKLNAISVADGKPVWPTPMNIFDGISGSLGSSGESLLVFTGRMELLSIDLTTQKTNWRQKFTQLPPNPAPVVAGDTIYAISGPFLIALNAISGTARWQVNTGMQLIHSPGVSADAIYVVSQDGKIMGYSPNRDKLTAAPIDMKTQAVARPTAVGKLAVVPTTAGGVLMIDPSKESIVWNYLIRPFNDTPAPSTSRGPGGGGPGGGDLGGGGTGGRAGGGQQEEDTRVITIQASAPAVVSGSTLLVPARDGSLLAFDRVTGVDLTAPSVQMLFPNPGDQVSGQPPLLLAFQLKDEASGIDISTIKVEIDGEEYEHTFNREGQLLVRFTTTGKNRPMSDGRRAITVSAVDWLGNAVKQAYALTIDNTLAPIKLPGSETETGGALGGGRGGRGGGLGG